MRGLLMIDRAMLDHHIVGSSNDRLAMWIWLLSAASWKGREIFVSGKEIHLKRGQLFTSIRTFSAENRVSKGVAERFLRDLKAGSMIKTVSETGGTVVTVCNYEKYQSFDEYRKTPNGTADRTPTGQRQDADETGAGHKRTPDETPDEMHSSSSGCEREELAAISGPDQLYDHVLSAVGLTNGTIPHYWMPPAAPIHVWRWHSQLQIPLDLIVTAARNNRARHADPPGGPKALDRVMRNLAAELHSDPMTPKTINGGQHEHSPGKPDRFQRIITAAAEGTSGQDWG